jgi:hypothetical protein
MQGIPVLHKPVTPARLRRTLEMLWQQPGAVSDEPVRAERATEQPVVTRG